MHQMSVIWLRVAAALYSLGLLHAILTLVRRSASTCSAWRWPPSPSASVFHFVSIVEEGLLYNRCPISQLLRNALHVRVFLIVVLFLFRLLAL